MIRVFLVGMGRGFVISLLNQFNESSNAGEVVLLLTIANVRMSFYYYYYNFFVPFLIDARHSQSSRSYGQLRCTVLVFLTAEGRLKQGRIQTVG